MVGGPGAAGAHRQGGGGGALDRVVDFSRRVLGDRRSYSLRWRSGAGHCMIGRTSSLIAFLLLAQPALAQGSGEHHADRSLEPLLPTTLGGVALTVESQAGTDLATNSAAFDAFLRDMGKGRSDFSLASAYAKGGLHAAVGAWRVRGGDTGKLLPGFKNALQASS